jgi:hypothetical protein
MRKIAIATLIATIVLPVLVIAWEAWSTADSVTLLIQKHYVLIENNSGVDDLKVTLGNREIKKLVATEVSLQNTGRHSIPKEDVLQPVTVTVSAPIVGIKVRDLYPNNMVYGVQQRGEKSFSLVFDVLNRGEYISLTILTDGEPSAPITAAARMKNISMLEVTDLDRHPPFIKRIWPSTYVLAGIVALTFIQLVFITRIWERRSLELDDLGSILRVGFDKAALEKYLAATILPSFGRRYRREARALISSTDPQDEQQVQQLFSRIRMLGAMTRRSPEAPFPYLIVILLGTLYVLFTLVIAAWSTS